MTSHSHPIFRPVADTGVLVEFGKTINDETHHQVLGFDATIQQANITGITECVPSYTCVLVSYDSLLTDYDILCEQLSTHLNTSSAVDLNPTHWQVPTCYAESLAPDIAEFADTLNINTQDVIQQHCAGKYKVYMYGFAPGYAYLGGVPKAIQLPRKQAPVMNVPAQTVMVAGQQTLITTITMPTGWWRIGMTSFKPLQINNAKPFVLNVGDTVEFVAMNEQDFKQQLARQT